MYKFLKKIPYIEEEVILYAKTLQPPYAETKIELTIPIAIPDLALVRIFAQELHRQGFAWQGAYEGWPAYYTPEDRTQKPPHSKQAFRPAEFWIGTDPVWTFTLSWEEGAKEKPLELESKYCSTELQGARLI